MSIHHESVRTAEVARTTPAHRFFWSVLAVSVTVSITGNAAHAVLHARSLPIVAAAVAVVPPAALLAAIHGVTVLLRAHASSRAIHLLVTLMTVLIAVGAFRMSFTALRDLAVLTAIPDREAWLWPMVVEGSMAQSTLAILALAHAPSNRAHTDATSIPTNAGTDTSPSPDRSGPADGAHSATDACTPDPTSSPTDDRWMRVAAMVCANDPAHRRDPAVVARILSHHHDEGWSPARIAREMSRSRSAVSRIISQANQLQPD
ncbi:DUF2637 domain-containing protein [Nocardia sp. ET3-3]|uniref:DUF2637 domain-containing protein n=1 Tax=Nocardia terrae TaxID=2675851 RepID=A0A7K1UNE9_9NOCA|nr:DUF2637 domain-containing protein [Nocardia terrae]MVU75875.1 DUF2637 domain-containing protein [Nocardia terrae]